MLVRAAKRSARLPPSRSYKAACEQLYLPWLCPSYVRAQEGRRRMASDTKSNESALKKQRNARDGSSDPTTRRSLATFVGANSDSPNTYSTFDSIPFDHSVPTDRRWSSDSPLMLSDTLAEPPKKIYGRGGFSGELRDILAVLEACLQVGRLERSGAMIKRLTASGEIDSNHLIDLHNQFLQASLNRIVGFSDENATQAMHKWFELEINDKRLEYTAETIAYMLKASLQSPPGSRRDRLVRRYMGMAPGDMGLEILSDGMFTAEELHQITSITQIYNYAADDNVTQDAASANKLAIEEAKQTALESRNAVIRKEMNTVPEVKPTPQKGMGLFALKQSLSLLNEQLSDEDRAKLTSVEKRERQMRLEEDAVTAAIDRWREENAQLGQSGVDTVLQTKSIGARMWSWHGDLVRALREELVKVENSEAATKKTQIDAERCIYGPFLRYLSVEKLAATTILTCMSAISSGGAEKGLPLASIIISLGSAVEDESISEKVLADRGKFAFGMPKSKSTPDLLAKQLRSAHARRGHLSDILARRLAGNLPAETSGFQWDPQWSGTLKAKIGAFLLGLFIDVAKIAATRTNSVTGETVRQLQPALMHGYQYKMGKKQGFVTANNALVLQLKREPVPGLLAKHLPMIVEPEPWTAFNRGGFLVHPAKAVRIKHGDKDQRNYVEAAVASADMNQMFKGLDVLGKTSWKINQPIFDVMLEAWNSGEGIGNFPPADPQLETPEEPEYSQDPSERRKWLRAVKKIENLKSGYHSQRCFQNFQLEVAKALREETFYFPHNVDFRGRAYPIPPYLNHMGADHCRGLLTFGVGKELGTEGLKWLKVQLANVFGFDKASLSERAEFADLHIDDIRDSVNKPLNGKRWWLGAEDPWQCLAACFELKNALDLPDPTTHVSHLPVHQDGTCNGLQHYAALGGDEWGAKQVNLEPGDRPADVYSAVADLVKQSIAIDKDEGSALATYLDGKITRKVVKQTVMTNVYGVTFIGAKAQVRKQIVAAYPDRPNTSELNADTMSSYIALKIFKALGTMFKGAHDIQYWLGECASRVSTAISAEQLNHIRAIMNRIEASPVQDKKAVKSAVLDLTEHLQFKSSVVWTSPLSMPIVQPYRSSKSKSIITNLQRVAISEPHSSDPVSKRKQLQGFPPNFVHSLDATHMILSAIECDKRGLSFAAVHDSFWTHAADIGAMNTVLRDAFISVHSDDVVGRLAAEFKTRYKGSVYLAKIKSSSVFGKALNKWRKSKVVSKKALQTSGEFVSVKRVKLSELMEERERQILLASSEPEDIAKAQSMTTAGSILEQLGPNAQDSLSGAEELKPVALGNVSEVATSSMDTVLEEHESAMDVEASADAEIDDSEIDDSEVVDEDEAEEENAAFSGPTFEKRMAGRTQKMAERITYAWLPLTFPGVPEKGTFDVTRLKKSQYFFS